MCVCWIMEWNRDRVQVIGTGLALRLRSSVPPPPFSSRRHIVSLAVAPPTHPPTNPPTQQASEHCVRNHRREEKHVFSHTSSSYRVHQSVQGLVHTHARMLSFPFLCLCHFSISVVVVFTKILIHRHNYNERTYTHTHECYNYMN